MAVSLADHLVEYWNALDGFTSDPTQSKNLTDSALEKILEKGKISKKDSDAILRPLQNWSDTSGIVHTAKLPALPPPANPLLPPLGLGPVQKPNLNAIEQQELADRRQHIFDEYKQKFQTILNSMLDPKKTATLPFTKQDLLGIKKKFDDAKQPLLDKFQSITRSLSLSETAYEKLVTSLASTYILPSMRPQIVAQLVQDYRSFNKLRDSHDANLKKIAFPISDQQFNDLDAKIALIADVQTDFQQKGLDDIVAPEPATDLDFDTYWASLKKKPHLAAPQLTDQAKDLLEMAYTANVEFNNIVLGAQLAQFEKEYPGNLKTVDKDLETLTNQLKIYAVDSSQREEEQLEALSNRYKSYMERKKKEIWGDSWKDGVKPLSENLAKLDSNILNSKVSLEQQLNGIIEFLSMSLPYFGKDSINATLLAAELHWFKYIRSIDWKPLPNNGKVEFMDRLNVYLVSRPEILFQTSSLGDQSNNIHIFLDAVQALFEFVDSTLFKDDIPSYEIIPLLTFIQNLAHQPEQVMLKSEKTLQINGSALDLEKKLTDYYANNSMVQNIANNKDRVWKHRIRSYQVSDTEYLLELDETQLPSSTLGFRGFWSGDKSGLDENGQKVGQNIYEKSVLYPIAIWNPLVDNLKTPISCLGKTTVIPNSTLLLKGLLLEDDASSIESALSFLDATIEQQNTSAPNPPKKGLLDGWDIWQ